MTQFVPLQSCGITRVLNVTAHVPGYHQQQGIIYKTLPAADSGQQNISQYFDEAVEFIGESTPASLPCCSFSLSCAFLSYALTQALFLSCRHLKCYISFHFVDV